jgi:hypothetical protein
MENLFIQHLLEIAVDILLPVVLAAFGGLIYEGYKLVRAKISAERLAVLDKVIEAFVIEAEKKGIQGEIENIGKAKLEYVLQAAENVAKSRGFDIELDEVQAIIEKHVFKHFNKDKGVSKPKVEARLK